ncbi:hypothetical protein [Paraburkholderia youngii]|uniref:hypothetical protein n=1 Tax=Paraburkholderia youngii TaxID=2782701 RepID=UPI003D1D8E5E
MNQKNGAQAEIELPEMIWETAFCKSTVKVNGVAIGHVRLRGRPDMSDCFEVVLYVTPGTRRGQFYAEWSERQYVSNEATAERRFLKMAANALAKGTPCALVTAVKGQLPAIAAHVRSPSTLNRESRSGWCEAVSERVNGWGLVRRESHRVALIKGNDLVFFAPEGADFEHPAPLSEPQFSAALLTAREWARSNPTVRAFA